MHITVSGTVTLLSSMRMRTRLALPVSVAVLRASSTYFCIMNSTNVISSSITAIAAAPCVSYVPPVILKYMDVASVFTLPPIIMGLAKSATDSMNVTKNALPRPGSNSGSVTVVNTFQRLAPMSRAASSIDGSMLFKRPLSIR